MVGRSIGGSIGGSRGGSLTLTLVLSTNSEYPTCRQQFHVPLVEAPRVLAQRPLSQVEEDDVSAIPAMEPLALLPRHGV
jgi:hypothetical protein